MLHRLEPLRGSVIPSDVEMTITRNYGDTAKEKSNELLWHMLIAVVSVSLLIAITLGFRESLIVFIAIPVTLALTLTVFYLYGYTLNRITLFALIFSIGILVDDAIVVVENIVAALAPARESRPPAVRGRGGGGGRSRQSDDSRHADRGRRDSADGVRRRPDGAVHAADPDRRQRGDGVLAAGGVHRDAVGRGADSEGARRRITMASGRTWSRASTAASWAVCCISPFCAGAFWSASWFCCWLGVAVLHRLRQSEDAAVRQQERVPGDRRHAQRHHARTDRARDPAAGRRDAEAAAK